MRVGYIGLGKMGYGMVQRLLETGNDVVVYNRSLEKVEAVANEGATPARSLDELVAKLQPPRTIWIMVDHHAVQDVVDALLPLLDQGDMIVDGGNSLYSESVLRAKQVEEKGVDFVDVGVSGGPGGARHGACMMVGGKEECFASLEPLLQDLTVQDGYGYFGRSGAGHFVKMVHNGIEYGMMQSIAEGFAIMRRSGFDLDLEKVARVYNRGSVIESRLMEWLEKAYREHGSDLHGITGAAAASGEGEWTTKAAHELGVKDDAITAALKAREASQKHPNYQGQIVSAMRNQFGGHDVTPRPGEQNKEVGDE